MTSRATQPSLLPGVEPPPALRVVVPGRRGRGATEIRERVVELPEANAAGRSRLTFRYRPLRTWTDDQIRVVEGLLERYFKAFGGFRVVNDRIMHAWIAALADYSAQEITWACSAKKRQLDAATPEERAAKRQFVAAPENAPQYFGRWLQQSPEWQAAQDKARAAAQARELDEVRAATTQAAQAAQSGHLAEFKARQAAQAEERQAAAAAREARRQAYWQGLTDAQRRAARTAVLPALKERAAEWKMNPEDPQLDAVLHEWELKWAELKWPPAEDNCGTGLQPVSGGAAGFQPAREAAP